MEAEKEKLLAFLHATGMNDDKEVDAWPSKKCALNWKREESMPTRNEKKIRDVLRQVAGELTEDKRTRFVPLDT